MPKIKFGPRSKDKKNKASDAPQFAVDFTGTANPEVRSVQNVSAGKRGRKKSGRKPFSGLKRRRNSPAEDSGGFTVNVRNTEPMLKTGQKKASGKLSGALSVLMAALIPAAALSLLLLTADAPLMIPTLLAGVVVYIGITLVKTKMPDRFRLITCLIIAAALIAAVIVLRKYIGDGLALIVNAIFERSQEEQAYIYDMYLVGEHGESSPDLCMGLAAGWCSAVVGFITALPGEKWRGFINTLIFIAVMICYAYFGVIPMWAGLMALVALFLVSAGNGRLGSVWPLVIAVMLVFGAVKIIDPGVNYTVSRANENLRDIFALKTAYIMGMEDSEMEEEFIDDEEEWIEDDSEFYEEEEETGSLTTTIIIIASIAFLIAAALLILHLRLRKRRKMIRANLDSSDPNTAIGAMFPYAVRWLQCCGINVSNTAFSELIPAVKSSLEGEYAAKYDNMMKLWREAVFSDHKMTEENRLAMSSFMKETMSIAKKKANWKEKLKVRFKYAL